MPTVIKPNKERMVSIVEIKSYTYAELCRAMGEEIKKGGKGKQYQLENWKRFFKYERINSRTFIVTEIYNEPKPKKEKRGGKRENSGAKLVLKEDIDNIINYFLLSRARDCFIEENVSIYFTNSEIIKLIGCYIPYEQIVLDKDKRKKEVIRKKLREKIQSYIYNRIENHRDDLFMYDSVIAYKNFNYTSKSNNSYIEYKDDWLIYWEKFKNRYLEINEYNSIYDVIANDKYENMIQFITRMFNKYEAFRRQEDIENCKDYFYRVDKCKNVVFNYSYITECSEDDYIKSKAIVKQKIKDDLKKYFIKKYKNEERYIILIDKYL